MATKDHVMYLGTVKITDVNVTIVDPRQIIVNSFVFLFPGEYVTRFPIPG